MEKKPWEKPSSIKHGVIMILAASKVRIQIGMGRIQICIQMLLLENCIHHAEFGHWCGGPVWFFGSLSRICANDCHVNEGMVNTVSADIQGCILATKFK